MNFDLTGVSQVSQVLGCTSNDAAELHIDHTHVVSFLVCAAKKSQEELICGKKYVFGCCIILSFPDLPFGPRVPQDHNFIASGIIIVHTVVQRPCAHTVEHY